ncbi:MAG: aldo/keto reductase [Chloroflexi bacterium]|nr:aldo/keto reductase [Chloroflexota bacterium]
MRYGTLAGIDKPLSRLVQGTVMLSTKTLDWSMALLDAVFEQGCRTFDTAHQYGNGECERVLGRWLRERGVRDQVVVLGKGAHHTIDRKRVTPFDITADLHDSLARLQVDTIDLYLLHRDDPAVPVGPIVETLNEHRRAGRIGVFGGSNWTHERIREANEYARTRGLTPFAVSSPNFSLAEQIHPPWRDCISISGPQGQAARAWYAAQAMPLFTWSSLAGGFWSGRITRENREALTGESDQLCLYAYGSDDNFTRLDRARQLAAQKGLSLPQVALAYVLNQPLDIFALVGCMSGDEFRVNREACMVELTEVEMAWLDLR